MTSELANTGGSVSTTAHDCFLREPAVLKFIGVSKITLRRWEEADLFPKRYKIGPHCVGWKESEVLQWIASRELAAPAVSIEVAL